MPDITLLVVKTAPTNSTAQMRWRRGEIVAVYPRAMVIEPLAESRRDRHAFIHVTDVPGVFSTIRRVLEREHNDEPDVPDGQEYPRRTRRKWVVSIPDLPPPRRAEINQTGETIITWNRLKNVCDRRAPMLETFDRKLQDSDVNG